jgi:hypothetical protein
MLTESICDGLVKSSDGSHIFEMIGTIYVEYFNDASQDVLRFLCASLRQPSITDTIRNRYNDNHHHRQDPSTEIPHTVRQRQLKAAPSQDTDTPLGKNGTNSL